MSEGCTALKLASQQPQLSVGVDGKRVQHAAPCDWQRGQPFPGSSEQLRPGHVADTGNPGNVVAVEADDSVAAEGGSANHLALEREPVAIPRRDMDHGPDALLSRQGHRRKWRHPGLSSVIVGEHDQFDVPRQLCDPLRDTCSVGVHG